jgi:hypothetical protein
MTHRRIDGLDRSRHGRERTAEGDVAKKQIEIQKYRDRQIAKIERGKNRTLPTPKAAQGEAKR